MTVYGFALKASVDDNELFSDFQIFDDVIERDKVIFELQNKYDNNKIKLNIIPFDEHVINKGETIDIDSYIKQL